jgi:shikimate kinase
MKENIILIGFMGVGKTEIGRALAAKLKLEFIDTDLMIEESEKRSISEIFEADGEKHFRDLETKLLISLKGSEKHVIATGGGIVLREENVKALKALGPIILITSDPEVIEKRLAEKSDRPLLNVADRAKKIRAMLKERDPIYKRVKGLTVDTSRLSVSGSVAKIIGYLKRSKQ